VTVDLPRRLLAEVVGSFGFFFVGFTGIATLWTQGPYQIEQVGIAAGFGFGLAAMIFALGHISGGHFNPAVTAGLAAARRFPLAEVLPYWGAQLVGGIAAAAAIRGIFTQVVLENTLTMPGHNVTSGRALLMEGILTALFVLVVCTLAADKRAPWNGVFAPFGIGLFIFTAVITSGALVGGSLNPARSLGPAIVDGNFTNQWIYIVGPLAGALVAGLLNMVFRTDGPVLDRIPDQPPGRP
jgi:MIP family channel proteins